MVFGNRHGLHEAAWRASAGPSRRLRHGTWRCSGFFYGACTAALDAFHAADNPVDEQLVADLEKVIERTKGEIERLAARDAESPG
jgi:hypothetical protein